jgi:hypothetical protein
MVKYKKKEFLVISVFFLSLLFNSNIYGAVGLTTLMEKNLDVQPRDVASSADGDMIFILSPGELIIYSSKKDEIVSRSTIDVSYDKITYSGKNNTLVLTSQSSKLLKIIHVEQIYEISLSGLPFKGGINAPVVIAVFDDYQ